MATTRTPMDRSAYEARMIAQNAAREADRLLASGPGAAEAALALVNALLSTLPGVEYPRIIAEGFEWYCPHCEANVADEGGITAVDYSIRWTESGAFTLAEEPDEHGAEYFNEVEFNYDGSSDYDGLHYMCSTCQRPVSLPEGVDAGRAYVALI